MKSIFTYKKEVKKYLIYSFLVGEDGIRKVRYQFEDDKPKGAIEVSVKKWEERKKKDCENWLRGESEKDNCCTDVCDLRLLDYLGDCNIPQDKDWDNEDESTTDFEEEAKRIRAAMLTFPWIDNPFLGNPFAQPYLPNKTLQSQLQTAIKNEDYEIAAILRDRIKEINAQD